MATNKSSLDFAGQLNVKVTESAANTLTFQKIESGIGAMQRVGWVLQKIQFRLGTGVSGYFNGTGDFLLMALTLSNSLTGLDPIDPAIIYMRMAQRVDFGVAASGLFIDPTFDIDFSSLQGGGLLVLPNPIYLAAQGSGLTTAASVNARIFFYPIEMADADYFNLVQNRQVLLNS